MSYVVIMTSEEYGNERFYKENLREAMACIKGLLLGADIANDGVTRIIGIEVNPKGQDEEEEYEVKEHYSLLDSLIAQRANPLGSG